MTETYIFFFFASRRSLTTCFELLFLCISHVRVDFALVCQKCDPCLDNLFTELHIFLHRDERNSSATTASLRESPSLLLLSPIIRITHAVDRQTPSSCLCRSKVKICLHRSLWNGSEFCIGNSAVCGLPNHRFEFLLKYRDFCLPKPLNMHGVSTVSSSTCTPSV